MARHCQAIRGWPGSAVGPEQAPTNLPSYKSFLTEVFPGPDTPFLVPKQNPSRPLYTPPRSIHVPEPDTSPTSFHSILISSFHVLHSLNKCSLLCLPPPHHQQKFESIHPNFSFREGAIMACPNANWKNRDASSLGARGYPRYLTHPGDPKSSSSLASRNDFLSPFSHSLLF